jgi:hypothetical protein
MPRVMTVGKLIHLIVLAATTTQPAVNSHYEQVLYYISRLANTIPLIFANCSELRAVSLVTNFTRLLQVILYYVGARDE